MVDRLRTVGIAEMVTSDDPEDVLVAYGLGSCVAVCMYDPGARVGGVLHALLPNAPAGGASDQNPYKFVDSGIAQLVTSVLELGAKRSRLRIALCGGAEVLKSPGFSDSFRVGKRNSSSAESTLKQIGLGVSRRAIGGCAGRTMRLSMSDGQVTVRSLGGEGVRFDLSAEKPARRVAVECRR